jgi:HD-GYP domain-containing protein (c-di-GMP phosphodiesterase class II)
MELRLSEVLGALSHALDITEGQPRGHAERSCLIAMRIAEQLDLDDATRSSLFYSVLLKDAGCSSNSAKVATLYGSDDAGVKRDRKTVDHLRPLESVRHLVRVTAPGFGKARRLSALIAHGSRGSRELTALRCERGADVASRVGLDEAACTAIRHLDEHWDGRGYPEGLAGEDISLLGRMLCLAQTAEVFWQDGGASAACEVARRRRGTWFDPMLVDALCSCEGDGAFWSSLEDPDVRALEPSDLVLVADDAHLDRVARAFATVIDAKSAYTARHSEGVADIAAGIARMLDLAPPQIRALHRAGLLHDIGKLGVSNRILDKPGKLTPAEWTAVRNHPQWSLQILERVSAFRDLALIAAAHHERLDGSGYFKGLGADRLDLSSRILAVADVAEALSAARPYRDALAADEVLAIMRRDAGHALDAEAFAALEELLPSLGTAAQVDAPATATPLRLAA